MWTRWPDVSLASGATVGVLGMVGTTRRGLRATVAGVLTLSVIALGGAESAAVAAPAGPTSAALVGIAATGSGQVALLPRSPSPVPGGGVAHKSPPPGIAWRAQGRKVLGVQATYTARVQGGSVGLLWMDPLLLKFRYIPGYQIPGGSRARAIDTRPSTWVPYMIAAFNGGFNDSHVTGSFYNGKLSGYLKQGVGTFAVTANGTFRVGAWGSAGLTTTSGMLAVRQELPLIVKNGVAQAKPGDCADCWGGTDGHAYNVNRAAVGVRADGSVVFAYGSFVSAATMARALVQAGVRNAMVLDMNLSWPSGFVYGTVRSGKPAGYRIHPGVYRDPSTYFSRFSRDFVVAVPR